MALKFTTMGISRRGSFWVLPMAFATLLGCSDSFTPSTDAGVLPPGTRRCDAPFELSPPYLPFGSVVIGEQRTLAVAIANTNCPETVAEVAGVQLIGPCRREEGAFCFEESPFFNNQLRLAEGESISLEVTFRPEVGGTTARSGFSIHSCPRADCTTTVAFEGLGVTTGVTCFPSPVEFDSVQLEECQTLPVECTNIIDRPVTLQSWRLLPEAGQVRVEEFDLGTVAAQTLAPGEKSTVSLEFCPSRLGEHNTTIEFFSESEVVTATVAIPVRGFGGNPRIEAPPSIDVGTATLIAPSIKAYEVRNTGTALLRIFDVEGDRGLEKPLFQGALVEGADLDPGQTAQLYVKVTALRLGPLDGTLTLLSTDPDTPEFDITVSAEGINLPPCTYDVSPSGISFGFVDPENFQTRTISITNEGPEDCLVNNPFLFKGNDSQYRLSTAWQSERIGPQQSVEMTISLIPRQVGLITDVLAVSISDPGRPLFEIPLVGTGTTS